MENKILTLEELAQRVAEVKSQGKIVGHCHGCFDLMHPGHIKHFQSAKKHCEVLIVTVTPDRFVNKGPGRPVFNERLRAESIASLEVVDYVAINRWPTAVETLHLIKPNYYIKGPDYRDRSRDVTGKISDEEEAIRQEGGELIITDDITFSSTQLLNSFFNVLTPEAGEFLTAFRKQYSFDQIADYLNRIRNMRICVIGDTIIDEYHYVRSIGKASKAPIISTKFSHAESYAGGILAIANHLAGFSSSVSLVSVLGAQDSQETIIQESLNPTVQAKFFTKPDSPTVVKRRYLDIYRNTKIFEVTFLNEHPLSAELEKEIGAYLTAHLNNFDLVIVADFGHGFINPSLYEVIRRHARFLALNVQTNSNNFGFNMITQYSGPDYLSIDENELRLPYHDKFGKVERLVRRLQKDCGCRRVNITLGERGSVFFDGEESIQAPSLSGNVVDSVGAGDAVLALTAALVCQNAPISVVSFVGNAVGGLAVQIIGNKYPVNPTDLYKFMNAMMK